jgi:hypothetical protein
MIIRHTHDLANAAEPHHMVSPFAILIVALAAYFSIPEWYLTQVVTMLCDSGARVLAKMSLVWTYVRLPVVVPIARRATDIRLHAHACGQH